ncbi:MAG: dockerin type I domain-containing protein, partial [Ruminococcus sp.]|nr:dockerin type I domain-containing protein [Ruminococcus sp.]
MLRTMRKALSFVLALTIIMSMASISQIGAGAASQKYRLGDVTLDGTVDVRDATKIQQYVAELVTLNDIELYLADVDGNPGVDVRDATLIKQWIAEIVDDANLPKNAAGEKLNEWHDFGSESQTFTATLSATGFTTGDEDWYAYTWSGADSKWVKLANNVATGLLENVIFARVPKGQTPASDWNNVWNQTEDQTTVDGGTFTITSWSDGKEGKMTGTWTTPTTTVAPSTTVAPTTTGEDGSTTVPETTTAAPVSGKTATL